MMPEDETREHRTSAPEATGRGGLPKGDRLSRTRHDTSDPDQAAEGPDKAFEVLLAFLNEARGFDFSDYSRASLMRRVRKRMGVVGVDSFRGYMDYLEVHPEEFTELFNTILINVTGFLRDPEAWEALAEEVIPSVLANKGDDAAVRVWSAACASGEEAYSIAMLLAEALGAEAFMRRVKVYATDIDEESLRAARQGRYDTRALEPLPQTLRERYFEPDADGFVFRSDLRRSVIFGRHNLVQDAAISKLDLLICRNTLMYFNHELQTRILRRFHFGLGDPGYLFLGRAEMLLSHSALFTPINMRQRIFRKVPRDRLRDRSLLLSASPSVGSADRPPAGPNRRILELAMETQPEAQFVIDRGGNLIFAGQRARETLDIQVSDVGRPLEELGLASRPVELQPLLEEAYRTDRPVRRHAVPLEVSSHETRYYDITIVPLSDANRQEGASVTLGDVTRYQQLQAKLEHINQELKTTSENLNSSNEELDTTNEELQSTIEELETTNEELQSANEEMETMNEELQASNQEMEAINHELRIRSEELDRTNAFLTSVLRNLRAGVAVIDHDLRVISWNEPADDLWGVRPEEAQNRPFFALDIGLPREGLEKPLRECMADGAAKHERFVEATNRRGRRFRCRLVMSPLIEADGRCGGAIVLMEHWPSPADEARP